MFPADFYVLEMDNDSSPNSTPIILGRPLLKTTQTKIDIHDGSLTMEFDGEKIRFDIFETMRYPSDVHDVFNIDVVDELAQKVMDMHYEDEVELVLSEAMMETHMEGVLDEQAMMEIIAALNSYEEEGNEQSSFISLPLTQEKLLPSIQQAPKLELKPLPTHLKYAFLGDKETLPMIIAKGLESNQE